MALKACTAPERSATKTMSPPATGAVGISLELILAFQPDYAEAWYNLGIQHLKLGEIEAKKFAKKPEERRNPHVILAIEYLGNALAYNQEHAQALIELGHAHIKVGNKAQALEAFRKAVDIDPKLRETLKKEGIFI